MIHSLLPWFGSKRNLAPAIIEELGPHSAYWEPFCGSMAVLLSKPASAHETVNDLHGDLVGLARVIQDPKRGAALYRRLRRTLCSEAQLWESRAALSTSDDPDERAYHYFVASWLGRNGVSGTIAGDRATFAVRWTPRGGNPAVRWTHAVASVPEWRRRLRRVTILQRDGFDVLAKIEDADGTAIYVDPPYLTKSSAYTHDFAPADHERLAGLLGRFRRARVVVSYYEDPVVRDLYAGWTARRIEVSKAMSHQSARGGNRSRAVELLFINGPSYRPTT